MIRLWRETKAASLLRPFRYLSGSWSDPFPRVAPPALRPDDQLFVVGASLGTRKKRAPMYEAVREAVREVVPVSDYRCASWSASSEPCLQVADSCSWAVRRKWERGMTTEYDRIASRIASEHDLWAGSSTTYY
jgi:hypothetical protein